MINALFGHTSYLNRALDAAWMRNEVINNNIANADTPDFKVSTVSFESELKNAMNNKGVVLKTTKDKHIRSNNTPSTVSPKIERDVLSTMRMDGNNVDIEVEQSNLAKNAIAYYTYINKITSEFSRLRYAINGGK